MTNPRQAEVEAALERFYAERAPKLARRRVVGGVVGSHQHQRGKRQRRKQLHWTQLRRYRAVK
ncbi:MAG: hypothetical protein A2W34_06980 [Chloroflexi bacterium RBG_16_64_32]|nr:MAG: hypothetical protein A2W34_06980 [Chloroflexi bacterium RBG_16_64_32]